MPRTSLKKERQRVVVPPDVVISRPREVRAYLRKHTDLAKVVPTICRQVREEFGQGAELRLEIYRDPEFQDHYLRLVLALSEYDNSVSKRLEAIWDSFADE